MKPFPHNTVCVLLFVVFFCFYAYGQARRGLPWPADSGLATVIEVTLLNWATVLVWYRIGESKAAHGS